mgnify:FL=1
MAVNYQLQDLDAVLRAIGRGVVFYAPVWDGTSNLALTHLGDTEGEITSETNEAYNDLTLPELTGDAIHERKVAGENPVLTIPLFMADPALRAIVSPTGNASGGYQRQRPVKEYTLVVFPEELFLDEATNEYEDLTYTGTEWQVGGQALTPRQEELLGQSIWFWRGHFQKPGVTYRSEDGGKLVMPVTFQAMHTKLPLAVIPDGHRLYTVGDPGDANIDIHPQA